MFGYVLPVKEELRRQDYVLYRAFYCGLCADIGRDYGQRPRFTVNYDVTFLSLLVHDIMGQDVEFSEERCAGNPFRKKVMIRGNELLSRVSAANILLSYYKLCDDVIDGGGVKKRVARSALKRAYQKAKAALPEADGIIGERYEALRALERAGETSVDRAADPFSTMLRDIVKVITMQKADDNALALCYNIGKFVYLLDALDDIDEDHRSGNYNPFLAAYGDFEGRKAFFAAHEGDIGFMLNTTVNRAIESFNRMSFTQSYTLLCNIVHKGLRAKAREVLESDKKLPRPKL